jgi:hypothetical protein
MALYSPTGVVLGTSLTIPADGETIDAVDVNVPLQAIADGLTFVSQTVTVARRIGCGAPVGVSGLRAKGGDLSGVALDTWGVRGFTLFGERLTCVGTSSAEGHHVLYDVTPQMVDGAIVTQFGLELIGNTSHVPAMMPAIGLSRYSPTAGTWQSLLAAGMVDDTSASGAAYSAAHDIRLYPDQNATVDLSSYVYYAVICPEGGPVTWPECS